MAGDRGGLSRLRVRAVGVEHIGKESHDLEEVQAGLGTEAEAYVVYVDELRQWDEDKELLRTVPRQELARMSGLHVRSIKAILNAGRVRHPRHRRTLHAIADKLRTGRLNGG